MSSVGRALEPHAGWPHRSAPTCAAFPPATRTPRPEERSFARLLDATNALFPLDALQR